MTTSPRLGFTDLVVAQAIPEVVVNSSLRVIEQGANCFLITDKLTAPPGSPTDGATYIVIATATGAWAGKEDQIAERVGSSWHYVTPIEGSLAYIQDEDIWQIYVNAWIDLNAPAATIWEGLSKRRFISPYDLYIASAPTALTSGATITPNGNLGFNFTLTIGHNATLANPTNFKAGQSGLIVITQDGTGGRTLAYGSNWKFPGGAPVLSTAIGDVDVLSYYVVTSSFYVCTLVKDFG